MLFVADEPGTVNQFVPRPVASVLVCDSNRQPVWVEGHVIVSPLPPTE